MAQKLLKRKPHKVTPGRARTPAAPNKVVLVGTYKGKQLERWSGYYNYPGGNGERGTGNGSEAAPANISTLQPFNLSTLQRVNELWLFQGAMAGRFYSAEYVGIFTRDELKEKFGYPATGKAHGERYALYKTSATEIYNPESGLAEAVIVRAADFATAPKIRTQIKAYLESPDRNDPVAAKLVPKILTQVPREVLRVCEAAVPLDFLSIILPKGDSISSNEKGNVEIMCESLGCGYGGPGWPDDFGNGLRRFFDLNQGRRVRTLSLFSGAGGLDIGFSDAGFDIVGSVEIEKKFCATLALNSGEGRRFNHSKVNCIDIREFSGRGLGRIDFIIGGPPCQTFSAAGRRANGVLGTTDARGVLFREYVRLLNELTPCGFLFENVYGLTGAQGGEAWREIRDSFSNAGYTIFSRILDAADFGVPQHRERLIIVGVRNGNYKFPRPTHGPDSLTNTPYYTAGTAIRGLKLSVEERKPGLGGRFGHLLDEIPPGLNYSYYTKEMGHPKPIFAWRSKFSDFLYKADPNAPVRTIKAQGGAYTGPLHWDNRFFACSEYKRLQTFPDDYEISGGKQVAVKQIGNSVPPQLARILAISIQEQLFDAKFPFQLAYLDPEDKLSFRSNKLRLMDCYRRKARVAISSMPKQRLPHKQSCYEFFCRISDRFKFEKCEPVDGDYRIVVKWDDELNIDVLDFGQLMNARTRFTIEIGPSKLAWDMPFSKVTMKSHSPRINSFTVAWKALENIIASRGVKADLVQLNGYYQYEPELSSRCSFSVPFEYSDIISRIVSGENVRRIVSDSELAQSWGVPSDKIVDVAVALRAIGYEIRNNKTNPQIEPGQWLIPYAFPTLNHMSVQLGKEIK